MKAFILAAGLGSRLMPLTRDVPKTLVEIKNGLSVLKFQIDMLHKAGFSAEKIFIIGGYMFEKLTKFKNYNLIYNDLYNRYNNIYSFLLIRNYWEGEKFLLLNGDTIFHPELLFSLVRSEGNSMVIDNVKELGEEEMKVRIKNGRIREISKGIDPSIADGEYIGISVYDGSASVIFDQIEKMIQSGEGDRWYEDAINRVLHRVELRPVYTDGKPWVEIDTFEDLKRAKEIIDDLQVD